MKGKENFCEAVRDEIAKFNAMTGGQYVEKDIGAPINQDAVVMAFEGVGDPIHVTASGREIRENQSKTKAKTLAKARVLVALKTALSTGQWTYNRLLDLAHAVNSGDQDRINQAMADAQVLPEKSDETRMP